MNYAGDFHANITEWLLGWGSGNKDAESLLFSNLERQLKNMCRRQLARVISPKLTYCPTEVFHELYLRLNAQAKGMNWDNRKQFFFIAGRVIRQILVDEIRKKKSCKRKGDHRTFIDEMDLGGKEPLSIEALDGALARLETHDSLSAKIVELRFFVGMTFRETAELLKLTEGQIKHRWLKAKIWLQCYLNK